MNRCPEQARTSPPNHSKWPLHKNLDKATAKVEIFYIWPYSLPILPYFNHMDIFVSFCLFSISDGLVSGLNYGTRSGVFTKSNFINFVDEWFRLQNT